MAFECGIKASDVRKRVMEIIDEMPAGREIDELINREVWGWEKDDDYWCNALWSTANSMSIQIIEKVNNEFGAEIVTMPGGRTEVMLRWQPKDWPPQHFAPSVKVCGRAETFALAVCRAVAKLAIMNNADRAKLQREQEMNNGGA